MIVDWVARECGVVQAGVVVDRICETSGREVLAVVAWLEAAGVVYQVNGGWAVDALAGRQTRTHRDVDVFVDETKRSRR